MKSEKIITLIGIVVLGPLVLRGAAIVIDGGLTLINKLNYKRKIKAGLKDGSIVEINGEYYDVTYTPEEEA